MRSMGEIIRNVRLQAVTPDGDAAGPEVVVSGIIDSGTASLIISSALARALRATLIENGTVIEDVRRTVAILRAAIVAPYCESEIAVAVVDDELSDRAGFNPRTGEPQILVGHALLQLSRARLGFTKPVRGGKRLRDTIECGDPRRRPAPRANSDDWQDQWRDNIDRADRRRR